MPDDQTADAAATETQATDEQTAADEQKPTETVEFWKAKAREQEKRAKANATAAERLAAFEQAQMSETERAAAALREAQAEVESARAEALRFKVASKYGVNDDDAELFLTGSDEETLIRQAERLGQRAEAAGQSRPPRPDPNQGRTGSVVSGEPRDQFGVWLNAQQPH